MPDTIDLLTRVIDRVADIDPEDDAMARRLDVALDALADARRIAYRARS